MKNTLLTSALVAILGFALAGVPFTAQAQTPAATTTAPAAPAKAKKAKAPVSYQGSITAIDASSVTVATTAKALTLAIVPTTKFLVNKKAATAADFAVGDKVTGSYTADAAGTLTAHSVHKKASATAAAPAAAPAAPAAPATPAAQ